MIYKGSSCQRWPANRPWAQPVYSLPTFLWAAHTRQPKQPVTGQWSLDSVTFLHEVLVTEEKSLQFLINKKSVTVHGHCSAIHMDSEHFGHDTTHMYKYPTCSPDPHHTMGNLFILIMEQWCTCLSCHIKGRRTGRLFWQQRGTPGDASVRTDQGLLCAEHSQFPPALQWTLCGSQLSPSANLVAL